MEETKKELNSYWYDKKLLKSKEEELEELITKAEKITTELSDMPKGSPEIQDRMAQYAAEIVDIRNQKYDQLIKMYKTKKEIEDKIDLLEQPYRDVLYYKYIKGLTLTEVANKVEYEYEYTKKLHGIALLKYRDIKLHTKSY